MEQALAYLTPDHLSTYFLFFIPGFIAMQVGALLVPTADTDVGKRIPVAIGYSALNFAVMSIALLIPNLLNWTWVAAIIAFAFIFVLPVFYPFWFKKIRAKQSFGITTPFPTAWDEFFSRRDELWVRVHLKNGDTLTGWFGQSGSNPSAASQYPEEQQLYISELWEQDASGAMVKSPRSAGIIVSMSEVSYLEFLK